MLDPGMDLEAALGIDSIKRVEILSTVRTRVPDLPQTAAAELAKLRTLGAITDALAGPAGAAAPVAAVPVAVAAGTAAPAAGVAGVAAPVAGLPAADVPAPVVPDLAGLVLAVVAEKTGYPVEMLDPGMDLEADLG